MSAWPRSDRSSALGRKGELSRGGTEYIFISDVSRSFGERRDPLTQRLEPHQCEVSPQRLAYDFATALPRAVGSLRQPAIELLIQANRNRGSHEPSSPLRVSGDSRCKPL